MAVAPSLASAVGTTEINSRDSAWRPEPLPAKRPRPIYSADICVGAARPHSSGVATSDHHSSIDMFKNDVEYGFVKLMK